MRRQVRSGGSLSAKVGRNGDGDGNGLVDDRSAGGPEEIKRIDSEWLEMESVLAVTGRDRESFNQVGRGHGE